ncbi:Uncharacterised protein [Starkeya nomas]|uniref:Gp5/Type VI secretion system Vgr protein OB-fold domain-containing protein n=1 Tax=Starkeya nomas TaxID=2666134 RepID=A0A5S9R5V1_9HYPH|nr:phage baseplate assembly protein V [Starkeya nomas]CAA0129477.1 Uncharacterised protein [Starkeya nomas]
MTDATIFRRLARLERAVRFRDYHLAELERRLANVVRVGTVHEVNPDGTARIKIGVDPDGKPVLTPPLPWTERAGVIKTWSPPGQGEQVRVVSPSGDIGQGWIDTGGFSTANPSPSDDAKAHVMTIGDVRITAKDGRCSIVQGDGEISIVGGVVTLKGLEIITDGKTRLNKGERKVHFVGAMDSGGDIAIVGADEVFV